MLRGSTPIQLSQLDISPAIQAGALEQQAAVNLASGIQNAIQNFENKREERKQTEIGIQSIQDLLGIDDKKLASAIYKDDNVRQAFGDAQKIELEKLELMSKYADSEPFIPSVQNVGGQQLFEVEPDKFKFAPESEGGESAKEEEINSYINTFGMTRGDATDLAYNNSRVVTDPESGNSQIVNLRTGVAKQLLLPEDLNSNQIVDDALAPGINSDESSINLYEMATNETTGFVPFLQNALQGVAGQIDPNIEIIDPENQKKIALFEQTQRSLVKALRSSSKVIASEMQALMKEFDIKPGAFKDVQTMRSTFDALNITINDKINFLRDVYSDMNISSKDRAEARRMEKDLLNFQRYLKVPKSNQIFEGPSSDKISNIADKYLNQ